VQIKNIYLATHYICLINFSTSFWR